MKSCIKDCSFEDASAAHICLAHALSAPSAFIEDCTAMAHDMSAVALYVLLTKFSLSMATHANPKWEIVALPQRLQMKRAEDFLIDSIQECE